MTNQLQPQRRPVDVRIPAIEKYAYCLCLHVRPTTIFIAVFKLIRALLFASILLNSELSFSEQGNEIGFSMDERHKSPQIALHILARLVMASVSAVGIYAVISGRAALLMPLYAMLLVDFFFALPSFYNRDLDPSIADSLADFRSYPNASNQNARYSLMLFATITMIVKIYFLCVIWKCYRYLRLIELVSPIRLSEIYPHIPPNGPQYPVVTVLGSPDSPDLVSGQNVAPPPYESIASNMKPPNYEEAIKSSNLIYSQSNNTNNLSQEQPHRQQTVIFTNPTTEQTISAQVISEADVTPVSGIARDNAVIGINMDSVSTASTVPPQDINETNHVTVQNHGQGLQVIQETDKSAKSLGIINPPVDVVSPKAEHPNSSHSLDV